MKNSLHIVKVGGQVVEDAASLSALLDSFRTLGGRKVLVVGGGRKATSIAGSLGIETQMVDGRRITGKDMLEVVTMVYAGLVNKNIVAGLQARGVNAAGFSGADCDMIRSVRRPAGKVDYGYVGDPVAVNSKILSRMLEEGCTPVFCAITHDGHGQLLNTNADTVASAIACAMAGDYDVELTFCFEKDGVLANLDDPSSVIRRLDPSAFAGYKEKGIISGGMLPKIENAFAALDAGVGKVVITNADGLGKDSGTEICRNF